MMRCGMEGMHEPASRKHLLDGHVAGEGTQGVHIWLGVHESLRRKATCQHRDTLNAGKVEGRLPEAAHLR